MIKMEKTEVVDFIIELFNKKGGDLYGGEAVTQLEHGLQAAHFAKQKTYVHFMQEAPRQLAKHTSG